jgi:hypothetical protein
MVTSTRPCTDINQLPKVFVLISPRAVPACCSSSLLAVDRAETKMILSAAIKLRITPRASHHTRDARDSGHFHLRPWDDTPA